MKRKIPYIVDVAWEPPQKLGQWMKNLALKVVELCKEVVRTLQQQPPSASPQQRTAYRAVYAAARKLRVSEQISKNVRGHCYKVYNDP